MPYYVFTEDQLQTAIKLHTRKASDSDGRGAGEVAAAIINDFMHSPDLSAMGMRREVDSTQ